VQLLLADLVIVRGTSPFDRVIEDVEHSPYSHVVGYVGGGLVIQAEGCKPTGYASLSFFAGQPVFRCALLAEGQRRQIVDWVTDRIGSHYAYGLLLWEWARYALHVVLPWWIEQRKYICSTLWADAYRAAGMNLCPGIRFPSPADLAQSLLLAQVGTVPKNIA